MSVSGNGYSRRLRQAILGFTSDRQACSFAADLSFMNIRNRFSRSGLMALVLLALSGFNACGGTGLQGAQSEGEQSTERSTAEERRAQRIAQREAEKAERLAARAARRGESPPTITSDENLTGQSAGAPSGAEPSAVPMIIGSSGQKAPPKGIYHSAGFLVKGRNNTALVDSSINSQDFVAGTLVRVGWSMVNPAAGQFDFSAIANELAQAAKYHSGISLAILDGNETPEWLLEQCKNFTFSFRGTQTFHSCLPWDSAYQQAKQALISQLGQQFDSHPNLSAVYFSYAAMTNGIEMHWRVNEADYKAAGYSPALLLKSYNTIMDMYAAAFKKTSIIMEVHSVFDSEYLAENAFEHCYDTLGSRCGVAIWWCASRMATNPREAEYKVYHVAQEATKKSFAVCQTIGNFSSSPDRFDGGQGWSSEKAFNHEMDFFIKEGFSAFELWTKDIKNPSLVKIAKDDVVPRMNKAR